MADDPFEKAVEESFREQKPPADKSIVDDAQENGSQPWGRPGGDTPVSAPRARPPRTSVPKVGGGRIARGPIEPEPLNPDALDERMPQWDKMREESDETLIERPDERSGKTSEQMWRRSPVEKEYARPEDRRGWFEPGVRNARLAYFINIAGLLVPLLPVFGAGMALFNRRQASEELHSHYTYAAWTVGLGIVYGLLISALFGRSGLINIAVVGFYAWWGIRTLRGLGRLNAGLPIENPRTWWL